MRIRPRNCNVGAAERCALLFRLIISCAGCLCMTSAYIRLGYFARHLAAFQGTQEGKDTVTGKSSGAIEVDKTGV